MRGRDAERKIEAIGEVADGISRGASSRFRREEGEDRTDEQIVERKWGIGSGRRRRNCSWGFVEGSKRCAWGGR